MSSNSQPTPDRPQQVNQLIQALGESLERSTLAKLVMAGYHGPEMELKKVTIRPCVLKEEKCLSFVYHYATRDITKNHPEAAGIEQIAAALGSRFKTAHLLTQTGDVHLEFLQPGKCRLTRGPASITTPTTREHDREKHRWLDHRKPFLHALGITDAAQQIKPTMAHKWKQINKFIEIFDHAVTESGLAQKAQVEVVDFGSGKGYLTFAIHEHLRHTLGREAQVTGVELREELVQFCNDVARREACAGLSFRQGALDNYAPTKLDALIALHACDTATDQALHLGVRAGAALILCAPCCHKQIRPQLKAPAVLQPLLRFGIHAAQEAELVTDGLRALLLEACGYQCNVFEFISLEHTDKNKMILGIKRPGATPRPELWGHIAAVKAFYGIQEQQLETLLRTDHAPQPVPEQTG